LRNWVVALLGLCVALAVPALALDVAGVKLDDRTTVGGQQLVLNGAGVRTRVMFKVYVASLYLPAKANAAAAVLAEGPRRIQMNLLRTLAPDQLVDALNDGMKENNSDAELAAVKTQTDQLMAIMRSLGEVKEGSVVTLDFVDGATAVGLDGAARGTVSGDAFNRALTKIWLGDKPVQADLKKALLGG
jgi:long-chain acyl-CoA synthetase